MSISKTENRWSYAGNGVQVTFQFKNKIFAYTDLLVYLRDAYGVDHLQVLNTDYTVSYVLGAAEGDVIFGAAPLATEMVIIKIELPYTQETQLPAAGAIPVGPIENSLDRAVILSQQLLELLGRCPKFAVGSPSSNKVFPEPEASKYLRWSTAEELENTALLETAEAVTVKEELQQELQNNDYTYGASAVGTDAYAITPVPPLLAYQAGQKFLVKADVANTGAATLKVNTLAAVALRKWKDGVLTALETGDILAGQIFAAAYDGTYMVLDVVSQTTPITPIPYTDLPAGTVIQVQNFQTGEMTNAATIIPNDDTIPQNTEGDQYMALNFTPLLATSKLKIEVVAFINANVANQHFCAALFRDTVADAIAAGYVVQTSLGMGVEINFTHYMTAGGTALIAFKVRIGGNNAVTNTFNGVGSARKYGGVIASSITITEIKQ